MRRNMGEMIKEREERKEEKREQREKKEGTDERGGLMRD